MKMSVYVWFTLYLLEANILRDENRAEEEQGSKNKKQQKNNSYLTPNLHLRTLSNSNSKKTLTTLKNGSRFKS